MKKFLIVIFCLLVCVFPAISYSDDAVDSNTPTTPLEPCKVIQTVSGSLKKDKPLIPSFYIGRRVYKKRGGSHFEPFLVKSDGKLVAATTDACDGCANRNKLWNKNHKVLFISAFDPTDINKAIYSSSGQWVIYGPSDANGMNLRFKKYLSNAVETINVDPNHVYGDVGSWWYVVGWNPNKDLFYFYTSGGADTGRNNDYYQFDPVSNILTHIGGGEWIEVSKDGEWIVWVDGNGMDYVDRQIHAYDIENNKDYTLTKGHSDNCFYDWVINPQSDKLEDISFHIRAGKGFYLRHQYKEAVAEYQKAVDLDPKNDTALGLMGYSYLRDGDVEKSILSLSQSLGINPQNIMSHYNLALAYGAAGEKEKGLSEIKKVIDLDPFFKEKIKADPQFKFFKPLKEFGEMMEAEAALGKTLEPEFQKLLPDHTELVQVQPVKIPGLSQAVLVSYYGSGGANAALLANGNNGPYIVWQAEPVDAQIYSSGIYYLGREPKMPICMLCTAGGASVGARPRLYQWDGKTFQPLTVNGETTEIGDGSDGIEVKDILGDGEKEIIVKYRPNFGDLDIIRFYKGQLVFVSKKYADKYKAALKSKE